MATPKKAKRAVADPNLRLELSHRAHTIDQISAGIRTGLRWAGASLMAFFLWKSIEALAGKETNANIEVAGSANAGVFLSRHAATLFFALLGGGGVAYGLSQKQLYKQVSRKLKRMEDLEKKIDPDRSGSGLDDGWKPNAEDPE